MKLHLRIWRQKDGSAPGHFGEYDLDDVRDDMSFLEMLDVLNEQLIDGGEEPVAFDSDCREGVCGMCSLVINGNPPPALGQVHAERFDERGLADPRDTADAEANALAGVGEEFGKQFLGCGPIFLPGTLDQRDRACELPPMKRVFEEAAAMQRIVDTLPDDAGGHPRHLWQRTTLYSRAGGERERAAAAAGPLQPVAVG